MTDYSDELANDPAFVQSLRLEDVLKAYDGRRGCMCGCNGRYYVRPETKAQASEKRGYPYTAAEVDAVEVARILDALKADSRTRIQDGSILFIEDRQPGERNLVVYLLKERPA